MVFSLVQWWLRDHEQTVFSFISCVVLPSFREKLGSFSCEWTTERRDRIPKPRSGPSGSCAPGLGADHFQIVIFSLYHLSLRVWFYIPSHEGLESFPPAHEAGLALSLELVKRKCRRGAGLILRSRSCLFSRNPVNAPGAACGGRMSMKGTDKAQ